MAYRDTQQAQTYNKHIRETATHYRQTRKRHTRDRLRLMSNRGKRQTGQTDTHYRDKRQTGTHYRQRHVRQRHTSDRDTSDRNTRQRHTSDSLMCIQSYSTSVVFRKSIKTRQLPSLHSEFSWYPCRYILYASGSTRKRSKGSWNLKSVKVTLRGL